MNPRVGERDGHLQSMMVEEECENDGDVVVDSVGKYYDQTAVVQKTSFTLGRGEFLTLLGSSGSGKSTTLGMISGFVQPSYGDVRLNRRSIVGLPPRRRNFGIVFQSYALFPQMTAARNVEFGLRMRKVPTSDRQRRVGDMLERLGLNGLAHRKPSELSGGQQQRVALARALITDPVALLLDEPLGALDRRLRQHLQLELKRIQRDSGVSVLYVTHDQEEAMAMSDRLAVMHHGEIVQLGTPGEVYLHPKTKFVAEFLGETNLFDVTIQNMVGLEAQVTYADGSRGIARVSPAQGSGHGRSGTVCIRPERVCLLFGGDHRENDVVGTVKDAVYLGASHRIVVDAVGTTVLVSQIDDGRVEPPSPGQQVRLGWRADDAQLLDVTELPAREGPGGESERAGQGR